MPERKLFERRRKCLDVRMFGCVWPVNYNMAICYVSSCALTRDGCCPWSSYNYAIHAFGHHLSSFERSLAFVMLGAQYWQLFLIASSALLSAASPPSRTGDSVKRNVPSHFVTTQNGRFVVNDRSELQPWGFSFLFYFTTFWIYCPVKSRLLERMHIGLALSTQIRMWTWFLTVCKRLG